MIWNHITSYHLLSISSSVVISYEYHPYFSSAFCFLHGLDLKSGWKGGLGRPSKPSAKIWSCSGLYLRAKLCGHATRPCADSIWLRCYWVFLKCCCLIFWPDPRAQEKNKKLSKDFEDLCGAVWSINCSTRSFGLQSQPAIDPSRDNLEKTLKLLRNGFHCTLVPPHLRVCRSKHCKFQMSLTQPWVVSMSSLSLSRI